MLTRREMFLTGMSLLPMTTTLGESANAQILACAKAGQPLPPGDIWFTPPLDLTDIACLSGTVGQTRLRPLTKRAGPLVKVTSTLPGDSDITLPRRTVIRDLRIVGNGPDAYEYGMQINGALIRLERVELVNCYLGLAIEWAVDVAIRDAVIARNFCNVFIPQVTHTPMVTTLRFSGCSIRVAQQTGVLIQRGCGITFDDRTIIESNGGTGLVVQPLGHVQDVRCRDVWFEANARDIEDPHGLVSLDNCWRQPS